MGNEISPPRHVGAVSEPAPAEGTQRPVETARPSVLASLSSLTLERVKQTVSSLGQEVQLLFFGGGSNPGASLDALQACQFLRDAGPSVGLQAFDAQGDPEKCLEVEVLFFPTLIIVGTNRGSIRFLGAPAGHGLVALAGLLRIAAGKAPGLRPKTKEGLASLRKPVALKVFVSLESEFCVRMALLAAAMAAESPLVRVEVINSPDFPVLSQRYRVEATPKTVVNDHIEISGARGEDYLLERLLGAQVPQSDMHR